MGMKHLFDVDAAKTVGIVPAILLDSIAHWCIHNKANGKNFREGAYWSYNSVRAFSALFPYMKKSAIEKALKDLESGGYIRSGVFNERPYDRTKWYTVTKAGMELADVGSTQMTVSKNRK